MYKGVKCFSAGGGVFVYDDDPRGRAFRDATVTALRTRCPELFAITFGSKDGKKIDANDVVREFGPVDGIKAAA